MDFVDFFRMNIVQIIFTRNPTFLSNWLKAELSKLNFILPRDIDSCQMRALLIVIRMPRTLWANSTAILYFSNLLLNSNFAKFSKLKNNATRKLYRDWRLLIF